MTDQSRSRDLDNPVAACPLHMERLAEAGFLTSSAGAENPLTPGAAAVVETVDARLGTLSGP